MCQRNCSSLAVGRTVTNGQVYRAVAVRHCAVIRRHLTFKRKKRVFNVGPFRDNRRRRRCARARCAGVAASRRKLSMSTSYNFRVVAIRRECRSGGCEVAYVFVAEIHSRALESVIS